MRQTLLALLLCVPFIARADQPGTLAETIREKTGLSGGLCVVLGGGDPSTAVELGRSGRFVVQILEPHAATANAARQTLSSQSLYGLVTVDTVRATDRLPYTEDLVNLLIVNRGPAPAPAEMLRVLCPHGWAVVDGTAAAQQLREAGFEQVESLPGTPPRTIGRKPWPAEIDVWTHARHAADGNAVSADRRVTPPRRIQWVTGEEAATSRMVTAEGRNYYSGTIARDSFNGLRLWQRDIPTGRQRPAPVVVGNVLYALVGNRLVAIQGATGETLREFPAAGVPQEILVCGDTLICVDRQSLRAVDAASGALLWQRPVWQPQYVVAGNRAVYYLFGDARRGQRTMAVCLDLASGQVRWQQADYAWLDKVRRTVCHGDLVVYEISTLADEKKGNQIQVVSAADGRPRWGREFVPGMNHSKQARAMFVSNSLWVLEHLKGVSLDPQTGDTRDTWAAGHCHCFPPVATPRFLFSGEMHLTDLESGAVDANRITKAACGADAGWIPANGLIYVFPKACVCWPMLRGVAALAGESPRPEPRSETPVLERGPADPPTDATDATADWPCYRQNAWRTGSTTTSVPATIRPRWTVALGDRPQGPIAADWADNPFVRGPITSPVIAGDRVFCARPDAQEVVSLHAADGRIAWRFVANGRVDSAPTIHRGLCLFGTRAGWVYCLRADDGRLVWRLRAAPADQRIVAHGQVESPWPVPGSVLVSRDVAYFTAGRHALADGGILVYAVDPASGRVRWQQRLDTLPTKDFYRSCSLEFECLDLLSREGDQVAMARWLFDATSGAMTCKDTEAFTVLEPDDAPVVVPRSSWTYAPRQNKRHKRDFPLRPLAVYRNNQLFACSGDFQSVFRRDFTADEAQRFDRRWISGWTLAERGRAGQGDVWPVERLAPNARWTTQLLPGTPPQRIAALLLAGDTLFAASSAGGLTAISATDGRLLARYPTPAPTWDGLSAAHDRLYLACHDGTLLCFAP